MVDQLNTSEVTRVAIKVGTGEKLEVNQM